MRNPHKRFSISFVLALIALVTLLCVTVQSANSTVVIYDDITRIVVENEDLEADSVSLLLPVPTVDNYPLYDTIIYNKKYHTLLKKYNINYNTIYETIEL